MERRGAAAAAAAVRTVRAVVPKDAEVVRRIIAAINNSSAFYFADAEQNYDWTLPQNASLWQDEVKTLFDPCPAGWRVPKSGEDDLNPWADFTLEQGEWSSDPKLGGMLWTTPLICQGAAWTPAAGYRVSNQGTFRRLNLNGYQWSSAIIGNTQSISMGFNDGSVRILIWDTRASGTSVRCVRE